MEYKMNREDIDEERRRKIEEHQKADIDLLQVMLQKYDIVALRRKWLSLIFSWLKIDLYKK